MDLLPAQPIFLTILVLCSEQNRSRDLSLVPVQVSSYISNMMFENNVSPPPSASSVIRDRWPTIFLVSGAVALFLGLHMATAIVTIVAVGLLIAGLIALVIRRLRTGSEPVAEVGGR